MASAFSQTPVRFTQLFINGEFVDAADKQSYTLLNPTNEEPICTISEGNKIDVERAVCAAEQAFKVGSDWRTMDASLRGRLIHKLADLIERDKNELAALETIHNGKPFAESIFDMDCCINTFRYYAGWADKIHGKTIPADGDVFVVTRKEPVGVVGLITPFNYPLLMITWKVAPALATGCTIVLKPARQTPLTALHLAHLSIEAGFPPGVINIVPGLGEIVGSAILEHPRIHKIAFTGSSSTGKIIAEKAGKSSLKRVSMETGGKSAVVIFPGVDIDQVVKLCHKAVFDNTGQICSAASRTLVHHSIYDEFVSKSVQLAVNRRLGDPFDQETDQGPQVNEAQFRTVLDFIQSGRDEGASLQCGGQRWGQRGYYIQPTVFSDVTDEMRIAKEEIFGPVQSLLRFETLQEAIDRCNRTDYGLAASIFTTDINDALTFAHNVRTGILWINTYDAFSPHTPWGGFKQSGIGRELGEEGLESYLEHKTITIKVLQKSS